MTSKIYKSAQGVAVDLGVLMLQNEHVRAVGNMKVNARGDKIDSQNQVVETKPQQIQRQNARVTTNVSSQPVHTSGAKAQRSRQAEEQPSDYSELVEDPIVEEVPADIVEDTPVDIAQPEVLVSAPVAPTEDPVITAPAGRVIDKFKPKQQTAPAPVVAPVPPEVDLTTPARPEKSPVDVVAETKKSGLAGAIARTREIKQELDRTRRQQQQDQGIRKI